VYGACEVVVLGQYISKLEKLSVVIKTPRESTFLLDIPLISPLMPYSLASLHDISPLQLYSNLTRLDMDQLLLQDFDSYKTFQNKFTPSFTGMHSRRPNFYLRRLHTSNSVIQMLQETSISFYFTAYRC